MPMTQPDDRLLEVIRNITAETGYPPDTRELSAAMGVARITSTGYWRRLMNAGRIRYDADERVVEVTG